MWKNPIKKLTPSKVPVESSQSDLKANLPKAPASPNEFELLVNNLGQGLGRTAMGILTSPMLWIALTLNAVGIYAVSRATPKTE